MVADQIMTVLKLDWIRAISRNGVAYCGTRLQMIVRWGKIFVMLATISCKLSLCFYYLLAVIILWCVWRWRRKKFVTGEENMWLEVERDFSCCGCYYGLCHDRCACMAGQKNLIKVFICLFSGGDGTGIILLLYFITPALPPAGVWCFFFAFFFFLSSFFSPYVYFSRFHPLPNLLRFTVEMLAHQEGKAEGTIYWNTSILYTWYTYHMIMLICYT